MLSTAQDRIRRPVTMSRRGVTGQEGVDLSLPLTAAQLSIWIDHSRVRLFSRILTGDDCKYSDGGAQCRIVVAANDRAFGRFVTAFKRGKTAHIEVQNAAVMEMSGDISLTGFAHQLGA